VIAAGIGCLALSNRDRAALIVVGIVATIRGCLLLGPLAIRILVGGFAGRVSIAPRFALRDLVRYQARSGAALAAVTLALGIAATVTVIVSAEAAKKAAEPPGEGRKQYFSQSSLYVATPTVLRYLGVDPATLAPGTDFLADRRVRTEQLVIPDYETERDQRVANVQRIDIGNHLFGSDSARIRPTFVTLNGLRRHGWTQIPPAGSSSRSGP
jgi:hypothetical protein